MSSEHCEYATTDMKGRKKSAKRLVRLPGETRHIERAESAVYFAKKLELEKRKRRERNG